MPKNVVQRPTRGNMALTFVLHKTQAAYGLAESLLTLQDGTDSIELHPCSCYLTSHTEWSNV